MPIPTPSDPATAALLAHVLSQTQQNISFLAAQNYISPTEAAELITRLSQGPASSSATSSTDTLANSMNNLAVGPARTPEPARRIPPPPARRGVQKARALWAYNEDGRVRPAYSSPLTLLPVPLFRHPLSLPPYNAAAPVTLAHRIRSLSRNQTTYRSPPVRLSKSSTRPTPTGGRASAAASRVSSPQTTSRRSTRAHPARPRPLPQCR